MNELQHTLHALGQSECHIAADTRHRIAYPNARPRAIRLFGLGQGGSEIATQVADAGLHHVQAVPTARGAAEAGAADATSGTPDGAGAQSASGVVGAIASQGTALERMIESADMVLVVARDGDNVGLASVIAQLAHARGTLVTAVLIQSVDADRPLPDATLNALRAASDMLVIVSDEAYVAEMLGALGA